MQTKSVLAILSFTMLFSSSVFSMGPWLGGAALRQAARQAGRSGMRQLPGKGAPRRFFSDSAATSSPAESSFGMRHVIGVVAGGVVIYTVGTAMRNTHFHHRRELEQKRQKKYHNKSEIAYEQRLTREVVKIIIKKQLPDEIVKDAKIKARTKYNKQMDYEDYPRERFCQLVYAFKAQEKTNKVSGHSPGGRG